MSREIQELIEKARRFLKSAEILLKDGDYDSCASRAYYAMFYTAEALLFSQGLKARSHKGVISLFGERFIKTGVLSHEFGKSLRRAYDLRQKGDYATDFAVSENEAKKILELAKNFLKESIDYLSSEYAKES